jgi:predicted transporter
MINKFIFMKCLIQLLIDPSSASMITMCLLLIFVGIYTYRKNKDKDNDSSSEN